MTFYDEKIYVKIQEKLIEIEQAENVRILHCVESGSRAWGFASPDSDYDVRFIYVRKPEAYLRLEKTRDVIEWQLDDVYDISGWDLQKALRLLHNSNPTLFEWNSSPIVYKTTPEWELLRSVLSDYFIKKSGMHHYLSTAKNTYHVHISKKEQVKLKKYFYVLRPLLSCKWILENSCPPPMLFSELAEAVLAPEMRPIVDELLQLKTQTPEIETGRRIDALDQYLKSEMAELEKCSFPHQHKGSWERLNTLFLQLIQWSES